MTGQSSDSPIAGARTDAELEEALSDLDGKDFSNRAPDLCKRILARLLRIHSKQLESSKLDDCLRAAFDVYASEIKTDGHQLTDQLLKNRIPGWVFNWAVIKHWLPYPPMRQSRHSVTYLDSKPRRPMHEPVPESQLTEMIVAYRIPDRYKRDIMKRVERRIAYWQAESLMSAKSEDAGSIESTDRSTRSTASTTRGRQVREEDRPARLEGSGQQGAGKPLIDSGFWRNLKDEFLEHQSDDPDFSAQWRARFGRWVLKDGPSPSQRAHDRPTRRFKKTAEEGIAELPNLPPSRGTAPWQRMCVTSDTQRWELWLNRLRAPEYNCRPLGSPIAVTEAEWKRMTESGKSLSAVRGEFSKIEHDEWERRRESGTTLASVQSELGLSIDADGSKPFDWLQDAEIKNVFKESARLCADLALGVEKVQGAAGRNTPNPNGAPARIAPLVEVPARSLSTRDQNIHDAVGKSNFENLTNSEMMRDPNLGRKLKKDSKLQPGTDATKACLDRIRRAKGYPLSRAITNKRSAEK
jgi:hypothetical protein